MWVYKTWGKANMGIELV